MSEATIKEIFSEYHVWPVNDDPQVQQLLSKIANDSRLTPESKLHIAFRSGVILSDTVLKERIL